MQTSLPTSPGNPCHVASLELGSEDEVLDGGSRLGQLVWGNMDAVVQTRLCERAPCMERQVDPASPLPTSCTDRCDQNPFV
ncbi:hypothetical protein GN956_G2101 [Arapaima gigas]